MRGIISIRLFVLESYLINKYIVCLSTDGYLGGICSANTTSGCFDSNAECRDSVCQCVQSFTDINGTCKAGKLIHTVSGRTLIANIKQHCIYII